MSVDWLAERQLEATGVRWETQEDHSVSDSERAVCTWGATRWLLVEEQNGKRKWGRLKERQRPVMSLEGQVCGCEVGYVEQLRTPFGQAV